MKHQKLMAVLILALGVLGCSPDDGFNRSMGSTDAEQIGDLRVLMTKHGIDYRETEPEGSMIGITYRKVDETRVAELRAKLGRQTAVKYREAQAREYLKQLLTQMKHDFIVSDKSDGTWIKWFPESEQQEKDISMKVVQHIFDLQAERMAKECASSVSAPSNSTLEGDARQERPRAPQCES